MLQEYKNEDPVPGKNGFTPEQREAMIIKYAYLVKYIAGRMAARLPSSVIFDDLISAGSLGLIDAVNKYDGSREVNIKTYAQYRIKGSILDELRAMDWYSRSMRKKITDIEKAIKKVEFDKGRPAEEEEIAEELGVELKLYHKMLTDIHGASLLRLDAFIGNDSQDSSNKTTFKDQMRGSDDPDETVSKGELKEVLASAIKKISKKEQIVISLYYYDELTLKEIGAVLDLTESRICQIHTHALIKLKLKIMDYYG